MCAVYIMPRIAKKLTEKLRKKAIRRKSLRQKKRTMKKKNNARRTRRNMRKRNKRGGAAAEEEEEEEAGDYNANNENYMNGPNTQPQTGEEIKSAMKRFTDNFHSKEEQAIAELMMKENNKVIRIMNPNGTVGKEIEVLKSIKDKLRIYGADLDEKFHHYLCEKLQITIDQLRANPQGIISTARESSVANQVQAVRIARQELTVNELNEILKIIKEKGVVASKQLEELKGRLGYNDMKLNGPDEIYAWAQFVAGCMMIASNTNSGSIMGVLTILFSNRKGIILEKFGPQKKPLKQIALELITSKTEELAASADLYMRTKYIEISRLLSYDRSKHTQVDTEVANVKKMADTMITVVDKFFKYIIDLPPSSKVKDLPHFSLVDHYINRMSPKKRDRSQNSYSNGELMSPKTRAKVAERARSLY
jgi:hypothetical protein